MWAKCWTFLGHNVIVCKIAELAKDNLKKYAFLWVIYIVPVLVRQVRASGVVYAIKGIRLNILAIAWATEILKKSYGKRQKRVTYGGHLSIFKFRKTVS